MKKLRRISPWARPYCPIHTPVNSRRPLHTKAIWTRIQYFLDPYWNSPRPGEGIHCDISTWFSNFQYIILPTFRSCLQPQWSYWPKVIYDQLLTGTLERILSVDTRDCLIGNAYTCLTCLLQISPSMVALVSPRASISSDLHGYWPIVLKIHKCSTIRLLCLLSQAHHSSLTTGKEFYPKKATSSSCQKWFGGWRLQLQDDPRAWDCLSPLTLQFNVINAPGSCFTAPTLPSVMPDICCTSWIISNAVSNHSQGVSPMFYTR